MSEHDSTTEKKVPRNAYGDVLGWFVPFLVVAGLLVGGSSDGNTYMESLGIALMAMGVLALLLWLATWAVIGELRRRP